MEYKGTGSKTGKYGHVQFGFWHYNTKHYQLFYRAGETINCQPPLIEGERASVWITKFVDVDNQESVSKAAGMKIIKY